VPAAVPRNRDPRSSTRPEKGLRPLYKVLYKVHVEQAVQYHLAGLFRLTAWCGGSLILYQALGPVGLVAVAPLVLWSEVVVWHVWAREYRQLMRLCAAVGVGALVGLAACAISIAATSRYTWSDLPFLIKSFLLLGTFAGIIAGLTIRYISLWGTALKRSAPSTTGSRPSAPTNSQASLDPNPARSVECNNAGDE
jgi:hypothetical protein